MTKKSPNTILADERKIQVGQLLKQGFSQSEIGRQLGIDRSAVNHIIRRAKQAGLQPNEAIKERADTPEIRLICDVLKKKNWTQQNLAEHLGKNPTTVYCWSTGTKKPGKETVQRLNELIIAK